ncbi:MAG: primosomal protein N' [Pseudomonadota bacterium]
MSTEAVTAAQMQLAERIDAPTRAETVIVQCAVMVPGAYTYRVPEDLAGRVSPGDVVEVPLGPRSVLGCVWDAEPETIDPRKLRDVSGKLDVPPIRAELRALVDFVSRYTLAERGMVLKMVLRAADALLAEKPVAGVRWTGIFPQRETSARNKVLDHLKDQPVWPKRALSDVAGVSPAVISGLIEAEVLESIDLAAPRPFRDPDPAFGMVDLTDLQRDAALAVGEAVKAHAFHTLLLDGVTGSGKTEVYFEGLAEAFRQDRQALVLMPEIALTQDFLDRFERRFGSRPGEWHSGVAGGLRAKVWRGVASGEVRVVVGARSALFLPFADLGLIVVDEEHDGAYKQEDRIAYNARDMAVKRGHLEEIPVVLASATPSLESRVNADQGRYAHLRLPARFGGAGMPKVRLVDMRDDAPDTGRFLSPVLVDALGKALEAGEQSLVFLNRRGYAPLTLCRKCGFRFECPDCSAWLVEHRFRGKLICHHCGHDRPVPPACPNCGAENALVPCGPGVERIAEELADRFRNARIAVLSSDLVPGIKAMRRLLKDIARGKADIVIGTQLVAKGHHFPRMTVVGIVDADLALNSADPRAAERTFQILEQVVGRAGRVAGGAQAEAFVQTYVPDNPVLQSIAAGDREGFYSRETAIRQRSGMPPFGRLAALVVSGKDRALTEAYARAMARIAHAGPDAETDDPVRVLGPVEAPIAVIRGRYRFRLLARSPRSYDLSARLRRWIAQAPKTTGSLRVHVDVDPMSFL